MSDFTGGSDSDPIGVDEDRAFRDMSSVQEARPKSWCISTGCADVSPSIKGWDQIPSLSSHSCHGVSDWPKIIVVQALQRGRMSHMIHALFMMFITLSVAAIKLPWAVPRRSVTSAGGLWLARSASRAAAVGTVYDGKTGVKLSRIQIESKLSRLPVVAIVNDEDSPYLTSANGRIGYFYLDPMEASLPAQIHHLNAHVLKRHDPIPDGRRSLRCGFCSAASRKPG